MKTNGRDATTSTRDTTSSAHTALQPVAGRLHVPDALNTVVSHLPPLLPVLLFVSLPVIRGIRILPLETPLEIDSKNKRFRLSFGGNRKTGF